MEASWDPPRRVDTARLTLRRYALEDAAAMDAVIPPERERLAPFMPWARSEPLTTADRVALVRGFMRDFDAGADFPYGVFDRDSAAYLGGAGLHPRIGPEALELGYWIRADREGTGLVREAVAALSRIALERLGASWVEIRCHPDNVRSRRVPESLGFALTDTRVDACGMDQHPALLEIWQLARADLTRSAVAAMPPPLVTTADAAAP